MSQEVEQIKQRLDIGEVISTYIPVQRAGGANLKAKCPFHQEKTASFYISRDRQMWHCFGCSEGGDLFTFVQRMEGIDFKEALKLLAEKAGVPLPEYKPGEASERQRLLDALKLAFRFYTAMLLEAPQAKGAREYIEKRGVSKEMVQEFGLGYSPDSWDSLQLALMKRGVRQDDLEKAGMLVKKDRGGYYDRFRNRLMFPIKDVHGQVIGFTARVLDPNAKEAKYVNTPQTALYNKSAALYGIDLARQTIREQDIAVMVEGNMDVIACHQAGFRNVIAASGTALTVEQLRLLGRYTKNISIAFDADNAGVEAARRGMDIALLEGFTVRVIQIPENFAKDPDECLKKDPAVWVESVKNAKHIMEYLIGIETAHKDMSDPIVKKQVGNALLAEIQKLPDAIEQTHWLQRVSSLIAVPENVLREQMAKNAKQGVSSSFQTSETAKPDTQHPKELPNKSRHRTLSEAFLAYCFAQPKIAQKYLNSFKENVLSDSQLMNLYKSVILPYTQGIQSKTAQHLSNTTSSLTGFSIPETTGYTEAETQEVLRSILFRGERDYAELNPKDAESEIQLMTSALTALARTKQREDLLRRMRDAEAVGDTIALKLLEDEIRKSAEER